MLATFIRRCAFFALVAILALAAPAATATPQEPQYATLALLLSPDAVDDPVCVVLSGGPAQDGSLFIESHSYFGDFAGADLTSTDALYITRGGRHVGVVWGFADAPPPDNGVMLLGASSDAVVEFFDFVWLDGGTLRPSSQSSATHVLVIITGRVR